MKIFSSELLIPFFLILPIHHNHKGMVGCVFCLSFIPWDAQHYVHFIAFLFFFQVLKIGGFCATILLKSCLGGGIGIRGGLKNLWAQALESSSLSLGIEEIVVLLS